MSGIESTSRVPVRIQRAVTAWLAKLGLAVTSTVVAFVGAELFLSLPPWADRVRPWRMRYEEGYLEEGMDVPFTTRPGYSSSWWTGAGSITTNPQGLRVLESRAQGLYAHADVICMGDSFTFGYLVDDAATYPARLAQLCASSGEVVVNAGYTGGFSFDSAGLRYRNALAWLRPRVLVYGVFPGNDFEDLAIWTKVGPDGEPVEMRSVEQVRSATGYSVPWLRESRLFVGLSRTWWDWRHHGELVERERTLWDRVTDAVRRFRDVTAATGTRLMFVIFPEPGNAFAQYLAARDGRPLAAKLASSADEVRRLKGVLDASGVEWHDGGEVLEALRPAIAAHHLPPLPPALASESAHLEALAARGGWQLATLSTSDGIHYSAITNAYIAVRIQKWIKEPEAK
jgi:hypothetical protein